MPKSAEQIAREALEEEERPIRERREEEARKAERASKRRARRERDEARKRLARTAVPRWFPGVEWEYVETSYRFVRQNRRTNTAAAVLDVWTTGSREKGDEITLGVVGEEVFFLRCKTWIDSPYGGNHVEGYKLYYPVKSAADVAREKRSYDAALVWPDSANWSD